MPNDIHEATNAIRNDNLTDDEIYSILTFQATEWGPLTAVRWIPERNREEAARPATPIKNTDFVFLAWDTRDWEITCPSGYQFSCWVPAELLWAAICKVVSERLGVVFERERLLIRKPFVTYPRMPLPFTKANVYSLGPRDPFITIEWHEDRGNYPGGTFKVSIPTRILVAYFEGICAPVPVGIPMPSTDVKVEQIGAFRFLSRCGKPLGLLQHLGANIDVIYEILSRAKSRTKSA